MKSFIAIGYSLKNEKRWEIVSLRSSIDSLPTEGTRFFFLPIRHMLGFRPDGTAHHGAQQGKAATGGWYWDKGWRLGYTLHQRRIYQYRHPSAHNCNHATSSNDLVSRMFLEVQHKQGVKC
ncbi:hypothetical protein AVEN_151110-1 [Araneus ventricosus]|uniref:Uncharacterized protein n=1 Tax=Araneus ventricosus TaxID=182803 RepID=A0A4Y2Q6S3_ARAVE|nr:hypothetical protein AVEN_151110-1 [Araneus ventricosus]